MLTIDDITVRLGAHVVLENASAQLGKGWRVGLVGRNGAGKSTLLAAIAGSLAPDRGTIRFAGRQRVGLVAQEAPGGEQTPLEAVLAADVERAALLEAAEEADAHDLAEIHERLAALGSDSAPARAASILAGLGFDEAAQGRRLSSFSGGWRMRVALAAALFAAPDLLLLDEPTNHLDLEASLWLEAFLRRWPRGLIVVSHDRALLDQVATHILHLDHGQLTLYVGDYAAFERARVARQMQAAAIAKKQAERRKHLQSFVDRFRYKASKARQAQSRLKMIARLDAEAVDPDRDDPAMRFVLPEPIELRPPIAALTDVAVGYEPGHPVLRRLTLRLDPDDRVALVGANGNGKSTLAKLLAGRLAPEAGELRRQPKLEVGWFAQHQIEEMSAQNSAFDHLSVKLPRAKAQEIRDRLGGFGFSGEKANLPVASLSGGERARLNFALITATKPGLLVLDEPTNHLDILSREALVDALNDFPGAVVLVTHDLRLIELTMDRLWLVEDGTVAPLEGDVQDYRRHVLEGRGAGNGEAGDDEAPPSARARRRLAAGRRAELAPLRAASQEAERALHRLEDERTRLEREFADPDSWADPARAAALTRRRGELAQAIAAAEARWLAAAEALEAAGKAEA